MLIYVLLLFSTVVLNSFVRLSRIKNPRKVYSILIGLLFFILAAARDFSVGGDLVNYLRYYRSFSEMSLLDAITRIRWEAGYIALNKTIAFFTQTNERALIVVIAFITSAGLSRFIYRQSKYPWLSWYLYIAIGFMIYPYSGLRAGIAMIIGLNGLSYLFNNYEYIESCDKSRRMKILIMYFMFVMFAMLFHKTAIVYALVYPLSKIKLNYKYYVSIASIFLTVYAFGARILEYFAIRFYPSYLKYINVSDGGKGLFILLAVIILIGIIFVPPKIKKNSKYIILNHILISALGLQLITFRFSLFSRVVEFFSVVIIIYIPYILYYMKKNDRIIAIVFICVSSLYLFYNFLTGPDYGGLVPYKFFDNFNFENY